MAIKFEDIVIPDDQILNEMEISLQSLKLMSFEELEEKFNLLTFTNPILVWKFLEAFGYDFHFESV